MNATTNITQVVDNLAIVAPYFSLGNLNNVRVGWTAGLGAEWLFLPNWSVKVEYLYYDVGSVSYALSPLVNTVPTVNVLGVVIRGGILSLADPQSSTRFTGNIVRAGIDYHFNWPPTPVVAKY